MATAEVAVVAATQDSGFVELVRNLIGGIRDCYLTRIEADPRNFRYTLRKSGVAAVIIHHATPQDEPIVRAALEESESVGLPVIVINEPNQAAKMTQWIRSGARDCLCRDVDIGRLPRLIDSVTFAVRYGCGKTSRWLAVSGLPPYCVIARESQELIELVFRVVDRDANVLITGETGTGKTHLATLIHKLSKRSAEPCVALNCAALPEALVESQLFGHVRGAFTGAMTNQTGALSRVGSGTLLLDEVDALPLASQSKLLHAVAESRTFVPLGSHEEKHFRGRLIVATNQVLEELVTVGRFRQDLYYRLNVILLHISPLRERRSEIRHLAEKYLDEKGVRISPAAIACLQSYDWPGNVRQLQNALEQAQVRAVTKQIDLQDIPSSIRTPRPVAACNRFVSCLDAKSQFLPRSYASETDKPLEQGRTNGESQVLAQVLEENDHNKTATARALGISRAALYKRMKRLGFT